MVVADMMSFENSKMVSTVLFEKTCCSLGSKGDLGREVSLLEEDEDDDDNKKKKKASSSEGVKKYELVGYDSLPKFLKHNEFILDYYRSEWPLKETLLSIFSIHNETLNVWTHLIGFLIFLALTVYTSMMIPSSSDHVASKHNFTNMGGYISSMPNASEFQSLHGNKPNASSSTNTDVLLSLYSWHLPQVLAVCLPEGFSQSNHTDLKGVKKNDVMRNAIAPLLSQPITRWPFFAFLGGAMFCLLASSACHLLSCHAEHTSYLMLRLDYAGISALIVTSFYPLVYYSFLCHPFFSHLYMTFITVFGFATILVSLVPVFETPEFRSVRAGLFFCMGVSGLVPIVHKAVVFGPHRPEAVVTTGYELMMGMFYAMGVVVYATRVPERWMPGKFDLVGHSHQLFHVLVIAGAYMHYLAGMVYLQWRDSEAC